MKSRFSQILKRNTGVCAYPAHHPSYLETLNSTPPCHQSIWTRFPRTLQFWTNIALYWFGYFSCCWQSMHNVVKQEGQLSMASDTRPCRCFATLQIDMHAEKCKYCTTWNSSSHQEHVLATAVPKQNVSKHCGLITEVV
jgi:hypothetical protein